MKINLPSLNNLTHQQYQWISIENIYGFIESADATIEYID